MKAAGISIYSLFRPVLLMALATAAATAFFAISVEPRAKIAFRNQVFQIVQQRASVGLVPQVFISDFPGLVLYAKEIDQQRDLMEGVFISDQRLNNAPVTIFARRGRLVSDTTTQTLTMHLEEGDIHRYAPRSTKDTYQTIHFSTYDIQLKADQTDGSPRRRMKASEMDFRRLFEVAATTDNPKQRQEMLAEGHQRLVLAISPLLFALVAIPLGIRSHRSGRGGGFALGLGIFLTFHLALSFSSTLVIEQTWPALATIWTPPALFLFFALLLIRAAARERPLLFATYRRSRKKRA